jgi:pterin-4a-carbinolamine dehydratase
MENLRPPFIFISYRRQDSSSATRWLYSAIQKTFGGDSVFVDTESIRTGANWPQTIDNALGKATILIVVIGPSWLYVTDEHRRRRIDREDDWVKNEVAYALNNKITIIPLVISKTSMPSKDALPPLLQNLVFHQAFELRDERWESDLAVFLTELDKQGLKRKSNRPIRYPKPQLTLNELSPEEIDKALKRMPEWELRVSEIPGKEPMTRIEFQRNYEFASFEDAIRFIGDASKHVSEIDHHPRWENVWRTVTVGLTTWDIGSKPSRLDVELAQYLDTLFSTYPRSQKISKKT